MEEYRMAEIEERLVPKDGLNTYNVVLTRLELPTHGGGNFTFAITNSMLPVAEFEVAVPASGHNLDRMTAEAHETLIDILRQLMFRAEKARIHYDGQARPAPRHDEDITVDRRTATDRRTGGFHDAAFADFGAVG